MVRNKGRRNKRYIGTKRVKIPSSFKDFGTCVKWLKRSVYLIARGKKVKIDDEKEVIMWTTLGSGFLASPNKMITAAHVISNNGKKEIEQHKDGDKYYLIRHDDENNWHCHIFEPKLDSEIFLYPDKDLGILYLNDNFYKNENEVFMDENRFIGVSKEFLPIGTE